MPFAIHAQGVTIAEDPSFGEGKVFAHAEELYVRADLLPLDDAEPASVELLRLSVL